MAHSDRWIVDAEDSVARMAAYGNCALRLAVRQWNAEALVGKHKASYRSYIKTHPRSTTRARSRESWRPRTLIPCDKTE